jgi:DivIVA domain-containing protein
MRKRRKEREELEAQMMVAQAEPRRITPMDIQQKEFRLAIRGYNERDVDEFLDALTEEMARLHSENLRLRDELQTRDREAKAAQAEAEATIRRARQEANQLLDDAMAQARAGITEDAEAGESTPLVGSFLKKNSMVQAIRPFLGREREFLQSMARLIQEHADSVRDEVRQIREVPPAGTPESGATTETEEPSDKDRTALPAEARNQRGSGGAGGVTVIKEVGPATEPAEKEAVFRRRKQSEPDVAPPQAAPAAQPADRAEQLDSAPRKPEGRSERNDRRDDDGRDRPEAAPSRRGSRRRRADQPVWQSAGQDTGDVFQPKRRVARPPVGRLEDETPGESPAQTFPRRDLPATQPFEPFRFEEGSPMEPRENDEEDERSLRELFWGEE